MTDHTALISSLEKATRPMWCDDFDMDLPKVIPGAREAVGELGDILLWTSGRPDANGVLNHPSVWNHDDGMIAFFGFREVNKPEGYVGDGYVRCTVWEALRDAWSHHYIMLVERRAIWDTGALWKDFEHIMWCERGWGDLTPRQADDARSQVLSSLRQAVERLTPLTLEHAGRIERLRSQHQGGGN